MNSHDLIDGATLSKVAERFGGASGGAPSFLASPQNLVYQFEREGVPHVLRLTPVSHRMPEQVIAELEWVNFLAAEGVPVVRPILSAAGSWVENVSCNEMAYSAAAFEKAPGTIGDGDSWNDELFVSWGQMLGALHRVSSAMNKSRVIVPRMTWSESDLLRAEVYLPPSDDAIVKRLRKLLAKLESLPKQDDAFGLIHADVHYWNFSVDRGKIYLFDFDNAEYGWFISDVATSVFEAATCCYRQGDRGLFARHFLEQIWKGYALEFKLDPIWETMIEDFVLLRAILMYVFWHKKWDMNHLTPFRQQLVESFRHELHNHVPFLTC